MTLDNINPILCMISAFADKTEKLAPHVAATSTVAVSRCRCNAKESEATHSITFRHSTVYPDSAAVVKEGGVGGNLPSPYSASSWQEVVCHALSIQPRLKSMPLHYNNRKIKIKIIITKLIYLHSLAGDDRVSNAIVGHALSIQPRLKCMPLHDTCIA